MTTGELKSIIAAYFEKTTGDLTINSVDLGLRALNNARKTLERQRAWFHQQEIGQLLVDPTNGALLANAVLYEDDETGIDVKSVDTFYLVDTTQSQNQLVPLYHHGKQTVMVRAKKRLAKGWMGDDFRYRSDDSGLLVNNRSMQQVYLHGGRVYLNPAPSDAVTVVFDCQVWMDDYTGDNDSDWMIEASPDYFQWKAIIELNNLWGQFVSGQDGNVPPPEKLLNEAINSLIEWDGMFYEAGRQPRATNA
jgi:hypothetical protein